MSKPTIVAIRRVINAHGGFAAVARQLATKPTAEQVRQWFVRKWASPLHLDSLAPLAQQAGVTLEDLRADAAKYSKRQRNLAARVRRRSS